MEITIEWQTPIQLTRHKKIIVDKDDLPGSLEPRAGVYMFCRRFAKTRAPFYIGETSNLRKRLKQHLQTARIADVLRSIPETDEAIKRGVRFYHFGCFIAKRGQQEGICLPIVQRYLIRQAVESNYPMLNSHLVKIRTHTLKFDGGPTARAAYDRTSLIEAH